MSDSQPTPDKLTELRVVFTNENPDDDEWSAHIRMLNQWTEPDRYLREIIQYARSGPHYPADMHVALIGQVMAAALQEQDIQSRTEELGAVVNALTTGDFTTHVITFQQMKDRLAELQAKQQKGQQ